MDSSPKREVCEGCCKQIYTHQKVLLCCKCNKVVHFKCGKSLYTYTQTSDQWTCENCCNAALNRYNPFESVCYNKYLVENPEAHEEIAKIKQCLSNCKIISNEDLNKEFFGFNKNPMSVFSNNIDGMAQNFDILYAKLSMLKNKFDFVALAETNIHESHKDLYKIPGYASHFNSKFGNKHKGSGLGVYVNENFVVNHIKEFTMSTVDIETFFIKVSNAEQPLNFGIVYRPPSGNITQFYNQFEKILNEISSCSCNTIVCGDFNINLLKGDTNQSKFENVFFGNCFIPTISLATHEKPGCDPSCIDNIFVSDIDNVISSGISHDLKVSHHCPTICFYDLLIEQDDEEYTKSLPQYDYCESNIIQFNDTLIKNLSLQKFAANEEGFNQFSQVIHQAISDCFKVDPADMAKSRRNRLVNPWITNGLIKSINYKNFLYEKWKKSKNSKNKHGDETLYEKYKDYRKRLKIIIKSAKSKFYSNKFDQCKGNSKKTWDLINDLRGKCRSKSKSSFVINGTLIKERRIIADEFNKYFVSVASILNENASKEMCDSVLIKPIPDFSSFIGKRINDSMFFEPCSNQEIYGIISSLDNGKASDISIRIIKKSIDILVPHLNEFYNAFIDLGIFPDILKIGQISPIFKKGNPQSLQNYRPVTTLPCFGKIFEKVIYSRLYNYCTAKNIIYENQYGFRTHHSTSHAVNYSIDKIICNIENKNHVLGIFIDLSKAFDTISHDKLLYKLENYGIRGTPLSILNSYMKNRQQLTNFNGYKSSLESVTFGVPQGSVLGPLLFILYINDIINCSKRGHFVMFADDTNIFVNGNSEKEVYLKANELLDELNKYLHSNQLHINVEKCLFMYFRPRMNHQETMTCARSKKFGSDYQLFVNGNKIKKTNKARYLGIIIDENLSWDMHLQHLEQKLNSAIITIKRIKKFIPKEHYAKLYHTLFLPHLTYGISAWGSSYYKLSKIFGIQKRCMRLLFGENFNFDHADFYKTCARARSYEEHLAPKNYVLEHTKPLFKKYKFLTVHNLHKVFVLNEIYKIQKYKSPTSLLIFLHMNTDSTRQHRRNNLVIPNYHLNISRNQFLYCGTCIWNKLNNEIFKICNVNRQTEIVAGSDFLSDFSTPMSRVKNKFKAILLNLQCSGDILQWEKENFKFI